MALLPLPSPPLPSTPSAASVPGPDPAASAASAAAPSSRGPRSGVARAERRNKPAVGRAVKRAAVLDAGQIQQMLAAADPREAALVALMSAGALRVGEAVLLTWADIDGAEVTVQGGTTKTGHTRSFSLPAQAAAIVDAWRAQCPPSSTGWIFPGTPVRAPLGVRQAQRLIQALAAACGIEKVSSHSFRRSALTAAHQAGLSLKAVAQISGHASLAALERYLDADVAKAEAEAARGLLFR